MHAQRSIMPARTADARATAFGPAIIRCLGGDGLAQGGKVAGLCPNSVLGCELRRAGGVPCGRELHPLLDQRRCRVACVRMSLGGRGGGRRWRAVGGGGDVPLYFTVLPTFYMQVHVTSALTEDCSQHYG